MRNIISRLAALSAIFISTVSCRMDELEIPQPADPGASTSVRVEVVPSIQGMDEVQTKSSVTSGESAVKDINIFFYHNGLLVTSSYVQTPSVASFLLNDGMDYNVYALANVGRITPVDKEADFIKYKMTIGSSGFVGSMNSGGIPMAWQKSNYVVSKSVTQLPMALVRLVSKIRFKVDMDALAGLKVKSIRLCNAAGAVTPFTMNGHGGSKITAASDAINGDYASASDLNAINSGGQIYFYALENCQGTLLSGNKDPWKKTPDNISVANLCTYLEVDCEFQAGFALNGTITYRVYLGQDNCTNFDIIRNVDMGVTLCLTKNLDNVSWKIDPDVDYNGSLGYAWIEQGLHAMDDLYVGETVQWGFSVNEYLEDFLGEGLKGCRLVARQGSQVNSNLRFGDIVYSAGDYFCDMKCLAKTVSPCTLWLVDSDGNYITDIRLEDDTIECLDPNFAVGDGSKKRPVDRIVPPQSNVSPEVNGNDDKVYLYLVDNAGRNLNSTKADGQYGFDLGLFNNVSMSSTASEAVKGKVGTSSAALIAQSYSMLGATRGTSMSGGPSFTCTVRSVNAGSNATLNDALSKVYHIQDDHDGDNHIVDLSFAAANVGKGTAEADFSIIRPKFFLADKSTFTSTNGYTMFGASYIASYNPSKLDFLADVIYVGRRKGSVSSTIIDGTEQINFRTGGSIPGYYLPTATRVVAYPYIVDYSSAPMKVSSPSAKGIAIDGKTCDVFIMDRTSAVSALSEADSNRDYMRAEVGIRTTGDKDVYYDYQDLNGAYVTSSGSVTSNAAYNYTWGDDTYSYRGCGWYTGEGMSTAINANKDANVASLAGYTGANVYNITMRQPVRFNISWNSSSKCPVINMSGNTLGVTFKIYVGLVLTSSCTTANNTGSSSSKHTYTVTTPDNRTTVPPFVYTLSGLSSSASLPNYATLESKFADINKNYWHENCTNAINLKSNRFSQMAMPESAEYAISIAVEDNGVWVPIEISKSEPTGSISTSLYTFYSHTARGTYASTSSMTNPDGSSRGSDSSVSSQASRYSDYTTATGSYKVKFTVLHDSYWNWYNL